ncbi:MAG: peptidylprolyl isomerase [Dethiobacteraceae bacterium]|jgi:foldase protein PrsA|nr:foldase [Bacillota bacterium]
MNYKTVSLVLVVLLLATVVGAVVVNQRSEVVATVNGEKITKQELYDAFVANGGASILEQLISERLIAQEAAKLGIEVTDAEVQQEIDRLIEENYYGMKEYYEQALAQYGITEELLKDNIRTDLQLSAIVRSKIEVSEAEVEEYFRENQDDFNIPEEIDVRHILVETEEEAEEVLALLRAGEDFAELAKEHSQDPGSADKGGALGFNGRGSFVKEFEDAAFALPVGEYSEPVKTEHGYHIIEVLERKEAKEVEFADVKEQVKEALIEEKVRERLQEEYNQLYDAAKIEKKL